MFTYKKSEEEKYIPEEIIALIYPEIIKAIMYDKIEDFDTLTSKVPSWKVVEHNHDFKKTYYLLTTDEFKFATINNEFMKSVISKEFSLVRDSIGYDIDNTILASILKNKEYALYEHVHKNNPAISKEDFIGFVFLVSDTRFEPHMKFFKEIMKNDEYKEVFKTVLSKKNYHLLGASRFDKEFSNGLNNLKKLLSHDDLKEVCTNNLTHLAQKNYTYLNLDVVDAIASQNLIEFNDLHFLYIKSKVKASEFPKYEKWFLNQKLSPTNKESHKVKL
jgi:hypothetical protein